MEGPGGEQLTRLGPQVVVDELCHRVFLAHHHGHLDDGVPQVEGLHLLLLVEGLLPLGWEWTGPE